ncbi:DeoR/GlpR family DNA-binding transcription regulator [Mesorhizobium captivum]|uniref:DeoR/GlpR family DNA-binding transcription regulator n=1 Tax=Mesorhizobium captivum TaxID=3072319 RepID=UPI002A2462B0|nr:DeoR/GlpR family DNA-binding transcription regulator [Mesorhizobium sp. VK23E]MDX8512167.1 DeoR/GlpR family DNA-binding transcription regulator [Mesorhizobium sp. VK23E]
MKDREIRPEQALKTLAGDQVPADSRHARQLARRQMMAEAVLAEGTMRIEDLTERFGISLMTAHRDLDELVEKGLLRKTRGIVSAAPTSLIESSDVYRSSRQAAEKRAIAQAAAAFLEPGQAVFFDDSTTVLQLVPHLAARVPLTAITNSITLMNELKGTRDLTLLGLGGQFYNWCNAFMGPVTVTEIRRLRADRVFMSMSAITDGMVFHQSPEMVETKRAMFDSAAMRILLADHTKFERRALHAMCALDEFDVIVVDDGTPPRQVETMKERGMNVVVAPVRQGEL